MASDTIMQVAIRQFGDRGFDGTSTRAIAAAANTVMSSITYHFGSKEGLYLACADHLAERMSETFLPVMKGIGEPESLPPDKAADSIASLIEHIALIMISDESRDWASFLIREQQHPGPAFERLYAGIIGRIEQLLHTLIARVCPELDDRNVRALSISLFGQALVLRAARATVTRALEVDELGDAEKHLLLTRIRHNIAALLRSNLPS